MKPTISGSNAFGVGPDPSLSDRYPPHAAGAESERPDADSPIGRLTTGELAYGREVSGIGLKGPKLVLLPVNFGCPGKADGSTMSCRNVVSRSDTRAFDGMHCASYTNAASRLSVRTAMSVNSSITIGLRGIITTALSREGAAMCNGHLGDPVSTRERRIVGGPTPLVPLFPNPAH
jgi:hypothetical protein